LFNLYINDLPDIIDEECQSPSLGGVNVKALMYADDIILMSTSPVGLQRSLDRLETYVKKWKLKINVDKSKIMIFNKVGRKLIKPVLYLAKQPIETVQSYTYLGIQISASGNFTKSVNNLVTKAKRATFKLFHLIGNYDLGIANALKLFDLLVKPILLYGCEAWGPFIYQGISKENLLDKVTNDETNKVQLFFLKKILRVHSRAHSLGVLGELGRLPIPLLAMKQCVKYWNKISSIDFYSNPLLKTCCSSEINLCVNNNSDKFICWSHNIKHLLTLVGFSHVWENNGFSKKSGILSFTTKLNEIYIKAWFIRIAEGSGSQESKLRTYSLFKKSYQFEKYLSHCKNTVLRSNVTKFRISLHKLKIETGRHHKPNKLPIHLRTCNKCDSGAIQDEKHVLISCPFFSRIRGETYNQIAQLTPDFLDSSDDVKLYKICCFENSKLTIICAKFIDFIMNSL